MEARRRPHQLGTTEADEHLRSVEEETDEEDGGPLNDRPRGGSEVEGCKAGCDAHCVRHHHLLTHSRMLASGARLVRAECKSGQPQNLPSSQSTCCASQTVDTSSWPFVAGTASFVSRLHRCLHVRLAGASGVVLCSLYFAYT